MSGVKLSISLPPVDVEFLDGYAQQHGVESRSAAVQQAVALLRAADLGDDYEAAWSEWEETGAAEWDAVVADGLSRT